MNLAPVVQKEDNTIHWINLYLVDNAIGSPNTYPLNGKIQRLNNRDLSEEVEQSFLSKATRKQEA